MTKLWSHLFVNRHFDVGAPTTLNKYTPKMDCHTKKDHIYLISKQPTLNKWKECLNIKLSWAADSKQIGLQRMGTNKEITQTIIKKSQIIIKGHLKRLYYGLKTNIVCKVTPISSNVNHWTVLNTLMLVSPH